MTVSVAIAHDYLTQRGGAERVVLDMARAFPGAPIHTTLYDPNGTFPEFGRLDIRTSEINRIRLLRSNHRLALPLLAAATSRQTVAADVALMSSSGWAHGMNTDGAKIVYCHAPARWLYQSARYLGRPGDVGTATRRARRMLAAAALGLLGRGLRSWDVRAAASADRYLANSTVTRDAIREVYGIEADIVPPPPAMLPEGPEAAYPGLEPGFLLCVARLLPYKNVDVVIRAIDELPGRQLVVVGDGPDRTRLARMNRYGDRVMLAGRVSDEHLRWLYRHCSALVAASYEDYGLSPLEAASFGRPSVVLRAGGFLDTVVDERTGMFFDTVEPTAVAKALDVVLSRSWDETTLTEHAASFSVQRFHARLNDVVSLASDS
jgi:glycosyltransferase involved in cell wall biosynthesis